VGDNRSDFGGKALELVDLVGDRPDEDALDARLSEGDELRSELRGRSDGEPITKQFLRSVHGRRNARTKYRSSLSCVIGDVAPHRGHGIGKCAGGGSSTTPSVE